MEEKREFVPQAAAKGLVLPLSLKDTGGARTHVKCYTSPNKSLHQEKQNPLRLRHLVTTPSVQPASKAS